MGSIVEQLADLINPKPSFDPEDDIYEETRAKLVDKSLVDDDMGDDPMMPKRKIGAGKRLHDDDPKYKGKVISRKEMMEDDEFDEEELTDVDDNSEMAGDEDEEDVDKDNDEYDDEEVDSDEAMGSEDEEKHAPGIFKHGKASEKNKGRDTINQIKLWESILETRIKVQKLLTLASQLPRPLIYPEFEEQGGKDISESVKATTTSLTKLGSTIFEMQEKLLNQMKDMEDGDENKLRTSSKFNGSHWDDAIEKRCSRLRQHRVKTLNFWYDKTRLSSGKVNNKDKSFETFERPAVAQIDHILSDRPRLIRRTQLCRSTYRVLGSVKDNQDEADKVEHDAHLKNVDEETFDDDDFYQQLLRQLIEQKTSTNLLNEQDSAEMTRNWLKLQRLRTKVKKIVDTKASKGRKLRYNIHSKLVSYMAPYDRSSWTHDARNQLVKSVFGKAVIAPVEIDNDINLL